MQFPLLNPTILQPPFAFNKLSMAPPLYVGDLDENIQDETLYDFFSRFGQLYFVRIMRDPASGKSRGFAYVNFMHPRDAELAKHQAQYEKIGRKHIRIMFKRNIRDLSSDANIFVKNIDPNVIVKDLHNHFSQFVQGITSAKVATNNEGMSLGYGYVQFEKKEEAEAALERLQNSRLKENELQLLPFVPKEKRAGEVLKKNIYVKHLPEDLNEEDLNKLIFDIFSPYGEIETFVLKKHPAENKYSAFICYQEESAASNAHQDLTENPRDVGSKEGPLYVNWHRSKTERTRELKRQYQQVTNVTNLFVKNLRPEVTEGHLKNAFQQFGPVIKVACKDWTSNDNQKKARFGFIAFANAGDANKAHFESLNLQEVRDLYLPGAQPYISFFQTKQSRNSYIYNQRKWKQQMRPMPNMIGFNGTPSFLNVNPNFINMLRGKIPPPFILNRPPARQIFPRREDRGPRAYMDGWKRPSRDPQQATTIPKRVTNPVSQNEQPNANRPINTKVSAQQTETALNVQKIREKFDEFLGLEQDKQRQILGELLDPFVRNVAVDALAPKVTGMLIDLSVLQITEILEMLENPALLKERIDEAIDLIESEGL